jgi:hypothetical protein
VVEIPKDLVCEFRRRALASQAEFSEIISNVVIELLTSMFGFLPSSLTVLAVERDRIHRPDRRDKSNHKEDSAHSIPTSLPTSPDNARCSDSRGAFIVIGDFITPT